MKTPRRRRAPGTRRRSVAPLGVVGCALAATLLATPVASAVTQTFSIPGASSFTVPAGVTSVEVDAIGGQGGGALVAPAQFRCQGGAGSRVQGTMSVTPGQTYWVVVGGAGGDSYPTSPNPSSQGGYNGGGAGRSEQWSSGGGGGASDIRTLPVANGMTLGSRLLIAGGGGGAGGDNRDACPSGGSGGANPGAGHPGAFGATGGQPGTQSAGGTRGVSEACTDPSESTNGALGVGGIGAYEQQSNGLCHGSGGGGGGGRYGGGGGGASQQSMFFGGGGGGAGSNYTAGGITAVSITTAARAVPESAGPRNGSVTISYAAAPPTVTISAPATNQTYAVGQVVATAFTCAPSENGGEVASCEDDHGSASPGTLDTSTPGTHAYSVIATSESGETGTASINYTVAAAPTATIATPANDQTYAVGQVVATSFSCTEGASGPGIETCVDGAGETSPGVLDTETPGTHTYTVTATSESGQTDTASITYTVAGAPTATITGPASNQTYAVDQVVSTAFSCADGVSGPGIASCEDGDGSPSPGTLDTSQTGTFTYTVTATSESGQTGTTSIAYTVAAAPTASITGPASNQTYAVDEVVPTAFTCTEGANGPGIESCEDGDGSASPGTLDTGEPGTHTYTVTATSESGQTGTASITYTVAAAPTATITAPEDDRIYAVDEVVPTAFTCADGASGPGIEACEDDAGESSPSTLDTSQTGTFTYTVTATSESGQSGTTSITYTVAAAPSATITVPDNGQTYTLGSVVPTTFSCTEGASGPGIASCVDGSGAASPGTLDTSRVGTFRYAVTATSETGQTGTASIDYTVVAPPAPPTPTPTPTPTPAPPTPDVPVPATPNGPSKSAGPTAPGTSEGAPTPLRLSQVTTNRTCIGTGPRTGRDVTVRYRLEQAASVRFVLERRVSPRPIQVSRCPAKSLAKGDGSKRVVYRQATASMLDARSGRALRMTKRLDAGRHQIALLRALKAETLAPGRYRVRITPRSNGKNGRTSVVYFWVVGRG
jgi:hypothetical protein